jgi:hypothetical protein
MGPFLQALNVIGTDNIDIQVWTASDARRLTPKIVIDWLLESDIHFVITHMHQSLFWNIPSWLKQMDRLGGHYGWPAYENLRCPIFLQDKYRYLVALPDITNRTFPIMLNCINDYKYFKIISRDMNELIEWMIKNDESNGFVVKLPFTTNCQSIRYCNTYEDVLTSITYFNSLSLDGGDDIPYAMVQPRLKNKREEKIVLLNCKAITRFTKNKSGKSFLSKYELFEFAENAMKRLKCKIPSVIADGLTRVDIMVTDDGRIIVNEFESLEATYYSNSVNTNEELITERFLKLYWINKLKEIMKFY